MSMLKLGYKASAEQFAPAQLLDFGLLAEEMGFDSCFISDHFQPWKHTDGHAPNSLVWLGALGARTQRLVMGTSVLTPTFVTILPLWRRLLGRSVRCFRAALFLASAPVRG